MNESLVKMFELSLGKKLGILFGLLALIGLIFYLNFLSPLNEEIAELEESINGNKGLKSNNNVQFLPGWR